MLEKNTLILGASPNPERYAYKAAMRLQANGIAVHAVGNRVGAIGGLEIENGMPQYENVHTVTLYINPTIQKSYYDYIFGLHPKRIIFNPGTENPELAELAHAKGIETLEACTLVMLSTGDY